MTGMKTWMLGAAMVAGAAALGATQAQAAEFGFHVRGPVAYMPPCPGPGYVWTGGYMANGYWIEGRWAIGGGRGGYGYRGGYERRDFARHDDVRHGYDRGRGDDHGRR
jgi:hypothetical protein